MKTITTTTYQFVIICCLLFGLFVKGSDIPPQQPKQTLVVSYRAMFGLEGDMKESIQNYLKQGWVVKEVAMMDDESWSKGIVVFEKY